MGLCSSSSPSNNNTYVDENDPQAYEAKIERIEQANEKNFLSVRSFSVVKELGCGIAEVYDDNDVNSDKIGQEDHDVREELDGVFTLVTVKNQAEDRQLRMRTFLRKYLLHGGKERAAVRVRPFIESMRKLSSVPLNQYILPLEYSFFNRTDCVIVTGNYLTDLEMLMRHGFCPNENEAVGILCSAALSLQHFHQSKVIIGNTLTASNIVIGENGRAKLSLFPISVTRIGYKRKELKNYSDEDNTATANEGARNNADSKAPQSTNDAAEKSSNRNGKESPGAKYRVQTKESEVRGDHNDDATMLRKNIAHDYLLLGRLAAQVFGINKKKKSTEGGSGDEEENDDGEQEYVMKDSDIIEQAKSLSDPGKGLILGLLNPNQEERWNYASIKKHFPKYDWDKFEDIKEEIYPPLCINTEILKDLNVKIMEEAKKREEGEDLYEDGVKGMEKEEQHNNNNDDEKEQEEREEREEQEKGEQGEDLEHQEEVEFIDHGGSLEEDDIESDYGDDELLPWEAQEVLDGWEFNSTVVALHQLSNHIKTKKLADFASYNAEFYKPQVDSGSGDNNEGYGGKIQLREDLKSMGKIISKELDKK
jgi:hypothetical protein